MNIREAEDILARVTYRKDWRFRVSGSDDGYSAFLLVESKEPDATGKLPGLITISLQEHLPLERIVTAGELLHFVRRAIHKKELHEADEWLKVDGVAPFYPH